MGFKRKDRGLSLFAHPTFLSISLLLVIVVLISPSFSENITSKDNTEEETINEDTREEYDHPPGQTILIDPEDVLDTLVGPPWLGKEGEGLMPRSSIPSHYDWRENNKCLMSVRDQGSCGNCWAVAAAIVYQARWCLKTGQKIEMSIEDLTECDKTYALGVRNNGCNGGHYIPSFVYAQSTGMTEEDCSPYTYHKITYPYPDLEPCKDTCDNTPTRSKPRYKSNGYYRLSGVTQIQQDILMNGPVAAQIKLYGNLSSHKSGVYTCDYSSGYRGGHTVSIVGWGTDPDEGDYWIVENTWGSKYHESGYLKFKRGTNECGIEGVVAAPNIVATSGGGDSEDDENTETVKGSIEIIEPEANSAMVKGLKTTIQWKTTNVSGGNSTIKIEYYKGTTVSTSNKLSESTIATVSNSQGYYNWTATTPPTSTTFAIITVSTTSGSSTISNTVKVIPLSAAPTITISSPSPSGSSATLVWAAGSKQTVQFTSTCSECYYRVRISSTGSSSPSSDPNPFYATSYVSSNNISFTTPSSISSSVSYKAYIDVLGIVSSSTLVGNVKSSVSEDVTVNLITPSTEMTVARGSKLLITWEVKSKDGSNSSEQVVIEWVRDGFSSGYDLGTFSPGSYEWTIPESMGLTKYRVKLTLVGQTSDITDIPSSKGPSDISPPITLVRTVETPSIIVTSPTASTVWTCGSLSSYKISWTSTNVDAVDVKLYHNSVEKLTFASNASNTGSLLVNIPCSVLSGVESSDDFSVKIFVTGQSIYAISNHFTIKDDSSTTEDCGLTSLIYPESGSSWILGTKNVVKIGVRNLNLDEFDGVLTLNKGTTVSYTFDTKWEEAADCNISTSFEREKSSKETKNSTIPTHCFKTYVTVPTTISTGTYTLKFVDISERTCSGLNQVSTTITTVKNTSSNLKITSLKSVGETTEGKLILGSPYKMYWTSNVASGETMRIELLDQNLKRILILDDNLDPSALYYRGFMIPCVNECEDCYLQISSGTYSDRYEVDLVLGSNDSTEDDSGNNSGSDNDDDDDDDDDNTDTDEPKPDTTKDIDIYVPTETTTCSASDVCPLKWFIKSGLESTYSSLTIILYTSSSLYMYISRDWPIKDVNYTDWKLPSDIPSGKYYVMIRTNQYPVLSDKSELFTVKNSLSSLSKPETKYMISWDMDEIDSDKVAICFSDKKHNSKNTCSDIILDGATNSGVAPWNTRMKYKDIGDILVCTYPLTGSKNECIKGSINMVDDAVTKMPRNIVMWATFILTSFIFAIFVK